MFERILSLFSGDNDFKTELPAADARNALGALMVRAAKADKAYLFEEVEKIDAVLGKLYDLNPVEAAKMRAGCELLEEEMPATDALAGILHDAISMADREAAVSALWSVVFADGVEHEEEDELLHAVEAILDVSPAVSKQLHDAEMAKLPKSVDFHAACAISTHMTQTRKLRLILGDQLTHDLASLKDIGADDLILMCEVKSEATYVKHHKKKIAFLFSAMRHFAAELTENGHTVRYIKYDDAGNAGSLLGEVKRAVADHKITEIALTAPGEYRVQQDFASWSDILNLPVKIHDDDRFLCTPAEFADWAEGRKQFRMEYFYREMRRRYNVLMDGKDPVGGQWNFDAENRKPPKSGLDVPDTFRAKPDAITQDVIALVETHFADHFGDLLPFHFAVTRDQALMALDQFITNRLKLFGDYQDAMVQDEPWMYHSHIGFYLNCGLLTPLECIARAENAYHKGTAPLNAVEGFIRQILGWREYVRGIYWLKMPDYKSENFLNAKRSLPDFYWTADTQMNCMRTCITETKQNAYAHHIQRLMVLGNFALIAGLNPDEVNEWYLLVYADAYEWVELPNVTGMILFGDGGLLASKPYAASGSYINKMSNYCGSCKYKPTVKNGPTACPFNYLYWDFIGRNSDKLRGNPRMGFMYKTLDRMGDEKRDAIRADTTRFFKAIGNNEKV